MLNKYYAKRLKTKDGVFDSQKEYHCWCILKRLQENGEISNLQRQVKFVLIPTQYEIQSIGNGKGERKEKKKVVERECYYVADFVYTDNESGEQKVVDVKSEITEKNKEFVIKRKLMLWVHNIKVEIWK